jgi:hypothetical protein
LKRRPLLQKKKRERAKREGKGGKRDGLVYFAELINNC